MESWRGRHREGETGIVGDREGETGRVGDSEGETGKVGDREGDKVRERQGELKSETKSGRDRENWKGRQRGRQGDLERETKRGRDRELERETKRGRDRELERETRRGKRQGDSVCMGWCAGLCVKEIDIYDRHMAGQTTSFVSYWIPFVSWFCASVLAFSLFQISSHSVSDHRLWYAD